MADDPHRDLLPVREGSCIDTCRSSVLDSRERHAVCKLDRYQLEDRYLRLHDEVQRLKKLSNSQEDKIKRLGTKLMRVAATPRSCLAVALDFNNDKNRVDFLELENAKLKDKITVMRNQILNHTIVGRSPSRSRRLQICNSSGPTTCRSAMGRLKSSSSQLIHDREDDNDSQNFVAKIEELEIKKKEMASKIEELEDQLASHKIGNQREKAAENVEYIRVWRQMKLQSDELVATQAANVKMTEQIRELNALLEEKTRNNKEITTALVAEKEKLAEMDEQLARAKDSQLTMREKDEQIRDLMSEMKILHQHNGELLALSSKYSQVEFENVELKKKISEQLTDNQSLKSAFSNEQANFTALQAANEQLMGKLHDLQKNIDSLTIQLKSFQSQNERYEKYRTEHEKVRTVDRQTNTNSLPEKSAALSDEDTNRKTEICKNCCQEPRERVSTSPRKNLVDREVQTENLEPENFKDYPAENNHKKSPMRHIRNSPIRDRSMKSDNIPENLTPDEMLKILDGAQINTPLEVEDAAIMRQLASSSTKNYVNSVPPSTTQETKKSNQSMCNNDPWTILLIMYKVLREFNDTKKSSSILGETNTFFAPSSREPLDDRSNSFVPNGIHRSDTNVNDVPTVEHPFSNFHDENNNTVITETKGELRKSAEDIIFQNEEQSNDHPFGKVPSKSGGISRDVSKKENDDYSSNESSENCATMRRRRLLDKFTETGDCTCNQDKKCSENEDCGYACVQPNFKIKNDGRFVHCRCDVIQSPFKSVVRDISTSIQNTFDGIHISRTTRAEGTSDQSYKSWQRPDETPKLISSSYWEKDPKFVVCKKAEHRRPSTETSSLTKIRTPRKQSNGTIRSDLTLESEMKKQSVSGRLHDNNERNSANSGRSNKKLSNDSLIDNNIVFEAREFSRQSKDSRVMSPMAEASPSPQEKTSLLDEKLTNNTSGRVSSAADSYITISPSVAAQSDSSSTRAMDDEDATSSDFRNGQKKRDIRYPSKLTIEEESKSKEEDTEKVDTTSVKEFNDLIRNGALLSSRESSSTVQDLSTVITNDKWDEYKKRSLASQSRKSSSKHSIQMVDAESRSGTSHLFSDRSISNSDVVIIRIESISLFQRCSLLEDSEIHQLYVEFSFLGYRGVELETISVPKPTGTSSALFNYMRKFEIDEEKHPVQRNIMRAMMTENDNPTIKFIVVSEPLLEEMETKECTEVGYAYFDIRDHILSGRFKEVSLTIVNVEQSEPIGILKITLLGADAIRRCMSNL